MPKLTKNQLRDRHIINTYNLANLQDEPKVWVTYTPSEIGRSMVVSGWSVHRVGYYTDPNKRYQSKAFVNYGRHDKEEKRLQALAWAEERYKITDWERSPFGSYHPVGTMARAAALEH